MATSRLIAWSAAALAGRVLGTYLPFALDAALQGEIAWGELRQFLAYLIRADAGAVEFFEGAEAPYRPAHAA